MNIDLPRQEQIFDLRKLWQEAFGDTDAFLDDFFAAADPLNHCRCTTVDGKPVAALYWFDCTWQEKKLAYLYAVATQKEYRGQGLCRKLMENTLRFLDENGYYGAMLVPGDEALRKMYASMGYQTATYITQICCEASDREIPLRTLEAVEYAALRRQYLPAEGVLQEGCNLAFFVRHGMLLAGEDFLLAGEMQDGVLYGELLGDLRKAPDIVRTVGCHEGRLRTLGAQQPFAMYYPLEQQSGGMPGYFGLAFD